MSRDLYEEHDHANGATAIKIEWLNNFIRANSPKGKEQEEQEKGNKDE